MNLKNVEKNSLVKENLSNIGGIIKHDLIINKKYSLLQKNKRLVKKY